MTEPKRGKKEKVFRLMCWGMNHGRIHLQAIQLAELLKQYPHLNKLEIIVRSTEQQDEIERLSKLLGSKIAVR